MLPWFRSRRATDALPHYSALKSLPSPVLPDECEAVELRRGAIERELLDSVRCPADDALLLTELLITGRGVVTIPDARRGEQCLLTFGTRFRAADYVRTLSGPHVLYVSSSPSQLVRMLGDLRDSGVDGFTIDRCPRCPSSTMFTKISSESMHVPADVIKVWAIGESIQRARLEFYIGRALEWTREGRLESARELALESVGHVYFEDPRPHLMLGQLAVVLGDRQLLKEAKSFLRYFGFISWERNIDDVERLGTWDFSGPVWAADRQRLDGKSCR
jgi:hypothetical protein